MINIFNLIPFGSLDGGRIAGAISKWFLLVGIISFTALFLGGHIKNPLMVIVLLAGYFETYQRFFGKRQHPLNYFNITTAQRAIIAGSYFGLVIALLLSMQLLNQYKKSVQELRGEAPVDYYKDDEPAERAEVQPEERYVYSGGIDDQGLANGEGMVALPTGIYIYTSHPIPSIPHPE